MAKVEPYETKLGRLWRVRYRTPDRRQTDKRGFRTKRDAQAWAEQLEVDKRKGVYVAPVAGRVKLGEYAQEWLDSKHKLKPSTRARYQVVLDTALAEYADVALGDISRQFVREWVADLNRRLAPASVHKTVGVLRQVLAMAVTDKPTRDESGRRGGAALGDGDRAALPDTGSVARPGRRCRRSSSACVRPRHVRAAVRGSSGVALERCRSGTSEDPDRALGDARRRRVRGRVAEEREGSHGELACLRRGPTDDSASGRAGVP